MEKVNAIIDGTILLGALGGARMESTYHITLSKKADFRQYFWNADFLWVLTKKQLNLPPETLDKKKNH